MVLNQLLNALQHSVVVAILALIGEVSKDKLAALLTDFFEIEALLYDIEIFFVKLEYLKLPQTVLQSRAALNHFVDPLN
jgi:hypothetical protein